ncbi:MAG: hypothetical protein JWQ38_3601 [Flavipsychrobacter sp.]|nr:hypothetical protein [Flavipsychrobacter sp.]
MKYTLIALLLVFNATGAFAQKVDSFHSGIKMKDIFWADGGMSFARGIPGASITYNYNVTRFLGLGAGAQVYDFHATMTNYQPIPALFWDVRFNIRSRKKSQYFLFLDGGLDIYKHNDSYWVDGNNYYYVRDDNGSYYGTGIGYFRPQTNRGWGHYVSLKLIFNHYQANAFNTITREKSIEEMENGTLVVSFGFKF